MPYVGGSLDPKLDNETKQIIVLAKWLGRFVEKPKKDGDLFLAIGGYVHSLKKTKLPRKKRNVAASLSDLIILDRVKFEKTWPRGIDWDPFVSLDPWSGSNGLLQKIRRKNLMSAFLKKLDLDNVNDLEKLFFWMEDDSHKLTRQMAEALVEILQDLGIKA
jgi:hypothetical protein